MRVLVSAVETLSRAESKKRKAGRWCYRNAFRFRERFVVATFPSPYYPFYDPTGFLLFHFLLFILIRYAQPADRTYFIRAYVGSYFLISCFCDAGVSPADRAFGAQRVSGGRTGRRFAPPSAAGSASRCHM